MKKTNPFPGITPWMQSVWHDVHTKLIGHMSEGITENLPDDLVARAEASVTPIVVNLADEKERWIEISDAGGNLITVIEILSPANKTPFGRDRFEQKLKKFWSRAVNTVEIDLIRGGISADKVRPGLNWPADVSQIIVTRGADVNYQEVYRCPLKESIPVFLIPLRSTEPDLPFDLQPLIDRCYEKGRYWLLDYEKAPQPALEKADLSWARGLLDA